jgi:SAM-dependent methyltransferase
MFMAIIRSQEAMFFQKYRRFVKKKILDFGCGDGFFAEITFGKKKIDVGLDLYGSRAVTAEKNNIYKKVVFYDGKKIPFSTGYFSSVISNCVLEHIPNLNQSLKEIKRVLKPGGYFLTSVMADKWEDYLFGQKIIGKKYRKIMRKKQEHYNLYSLKKWTDTFKKIGFRVIKVDGYMNKKNSAFMDIAHYLSLSSLLSFGVFKKWVIFPQWYKLIGFDRIIKGLIMEKSKSDQPAAYFFVLQNIK